MIYFTLRGVQCRRTEGRAVWRSETLGGWSAAVGYPVSCMVCVVCVCVCVCLCVCVCVCVCVEYFVNSIGSIFVLSAKHFVLI